MKLCAKCVHYYGGLGDICCDFCDSMVNDYWEEVDDYEYSYDDSIDYADNC